MKSADTCGPASIEDVWLQYLDGTLSDRGVEGLNVSLIKNESLRRECAEILLTEIQLGEICKGMSRGERESLVSGGKTITKVLYRIAAGAAAAAAVAVLLILFMRDETYPAPHVSGRYKVTGADTAARGATVTASGGEARLSLGNYCRIMLEPESAVTIEGKQYEEQILLKKGKILCDIDSDQGTFCVGTGAGSVRVTGTRFIAALIQEQGEQNMNAKRMFVKVVAGAVLVTGTWGSMSLSAGEEATVPERKKDAEQRGLPRSLYGFSGMVSGIVASKGDGHIRLTVGELLRVWKGNKASNARSIIGRTVDVGPRMVRNERGTWQKNRLHSAFLMSLRRGQHIVLEISHAGRNRFQVLELSGKQRKHAKRAADRRRESDREDERHAEEGRNIRHDEEGREIRHDEDVRNIRRDEEGREIRRDEKGGKGRHDDEREFRNNGREEKPATRKEQIIKLEAELREMMIRMKKLERELKKLRRNERKREKEFQKKGDNREERGHGEEGKRRDKEEIDQ